MLEPNAAHCARGVLVPRCREQEASPAADPQVIMHHFRYHNINNHSHLFFVHSLQIIFRNRVVRVRFSGSQQSIQITPGAKQ